MSGVVANRARLFVAVVPAGEVVDAIDVAVAPIRAARPQLRWVDRDRWHVTLAFLGNVADDRRPELCERLGRAARRHRPLRVGLGGAGRFGERVAWARLTGDTDALRKVAASASAAARRARIPMQDKPFRAHLTLATARPPGSVRAAVADLDAVLRIDPAVVDRLCLVHSRLGAGPGGTPRYETVADWPLGGS